MARSCFAVSTLRRLGLTRNPHPYGNLDAVRTRIQLLRRVAAALYLEANVLMNVAGVRAVYPDAYSLKGGRASP